MTRRPTDQETPLEKTLTDVPQEQAPGDLQDRCLAALDAAEAVRPRRRPVPWSQFAIAAAASLLIGLVMIPALNPAKKSPSGPGHDLRFAAGPSGPAAPPAAGAPGGMTAATTSEPRAARTESPAQILAGDNRSWQARDAWKPKGREGGGAGMPGGAPSPGGPGGPGGPAAGPPGSPIATQTINEPHGSAFEGGRSRAAAAPRGQDVATSDREVRAIAAPGAPPASDSSVQGARGDDVAQQRAPAAAPPMEMPEADRVVPTPSQPWYDRAPDRKKIRHRDMQIKTPDVEKVYQDAMQIVEKGGGYVANEELTVEEHKPDRATIEARVPVEQFDTVLQQLRGLGKLVKLTGTSEDVTLEYKSRGGDIRGLSVAEQDLVERYERESNSYRKSAIKLELDSLRRTLHDEKQALQQLAAEAAFGYLNIEITESSHVWKTIKDRSAEALPIAMALALVALPFFVVALIWRRRA